MDRTVAVVGAGAAGLTAAIRAAEGGARVRLLNAHPRIGLKILMSGGTRCNVTHREVSARDFNGGSRAFVARVLRAFPAPDTREWFESLGVTLKLEPSGKYFPATDDAETVLDALLGACARLGVAVEHGARVVRIAAAAAPGEDEREVEGVLGNPDRAPSAVALPEPWFADAARGGWRLGVHTVRDSAAFDAVAAHRRAAWPLPPAAPDRWIDADRVVLACGGLSFPRTGSDGVGYALASALGHTIVPPVPALTPLTAADPLCREAQGVTLGAALSLWVGGKRVKEIEGSLLIAHFGFSGPAALDLSRHWLRAEGAGERRVIASFLPGENAESAARAWIAAVAATPQLTVRRWLAARLPDRIAALLCDVAGVEPGAAIAQTSREGRAKLLRELLAHDLQVTGTLGYEKAEATAGGVELSEVNPSTLESRRAPGVHLCGEMLDVDGRLGGFNFQWAWSSGTVAGRAAGAAPTR